MMLYRFFILNLFLNVYTHYNCPEPHFKNSSYWTYSRGGPAERTLVDNNRGDYNVGEMHQTEGFNYNANQAYAADESVFSYEDISWSGNAGNGNNKKQYEEVFLEGSMLPMSWTAQHGCGNGKNNCNIVMEYTCDTHPQNLNVLNNGNNNNGDIVASIQGGHWDNDYRNYDI